ncbi:MAG: hypothetical protein AAGC74_05905, partial [Verrucomicrobiota bacterium]
APCPPTTPSSIDPKPVPHHPHAVFPRFIVIPFAFLIGATALTAEVEDDLTLGLEVVSGYRSAYVARGFELADGTLDLQAETEIALNNDLFLGLYAWHATESNGNFSETSAGLDLTREFDPLQLTATLRYQSYSGSLFQDGILLGLETTYFLSDSWDLSLNSLYDFGAEAPYGSLELGWSQPLSEDLFVSAESGLSIVDSYYGRSGLNDYYGRISLTYNLNSTISLSPFLGFSIPLEDHSSNTVYGGFWFAVSF